MGTRSLFKADIFKRKTVLDYYLWIYFVVYFILRFALAEHAFYGSRGRGTNRCVALVCDIEHSGRHIGDFVFHAAFYEIRGADAPCLEKLYQMWNCFCIYCFSYELLFAEYIFIFLVLFHFSPTRNFSTKWFCKSKEILFFKYLLSIIF